MTVHIGHEMRLVLKQVRRCIISAHGRLAAGVCNTLYDLMFAATRRNGTREGWHSGAALIMSIWFIMLRSDSRVRQ